MCSAKQIPSVPLRSHSLFEVCTRGKNVGSGETKENSAMCDFVAPTGITNVSANPKASRDGFGDGIASFWLPRRVWSIYLTTICDQPEIVCVNALGDFIRY